MFGFGKLSPTKYHQSDWYEPVEAIYIKVDEFFRSQPETQFRESPLLCFIIAPRTYDPAFDPPALITWIAPQTVTAATHTDLRTIAFVLYSRIRIFTPPATECDLFYGFRYQPPFLLRRSGDVMRIHIAWDPLTHMTAWIDDIGSVLAVRPGVEIVNLRRIVSELKDQFADIDIEVTLSVLGEGITEEQFGFLENRVSVENERMSVYAISPAPAVQVCFGQEFEDDALLIEKREQIWEGEFRQPLATGFVISKKKPAWMCSLYESESRESPPTVLFDFVKEMSSLSWLSVKPGAEKRTVSYPPHIAALLSQNGTDTRIVGRFEFLPSSEDLSHVFL
jgi:hypothetical protein